MLFSHLNALGSPDGVRPKRNVAHDIKENISTRAFCHQPLLQFLTSQPKSVSSEFAIHPSLRVEVRVLRVIYILFEPHNRIFMKFGILYIFPLIRATASLQNYCCQLVTLRYELEIFYCYSQYMLFSCLLQRYIPIVGTKTFYWEKTNSVFYKIEKNESYMENFGNKDIESLKLSICADYITPLVSLHSLEFLLYTQCCC